MGVESVPIFGAVDLTPQSHAPLVVRVQVWTSHSLLCSPAGESTTEDSRHLVTQRHVSPGIEEGLGAGEVPFARSPVEERNAVALQAQQRSRRERGSWALLVGGDHWGGTL